jgi:basic membrane protein A and related proteins
VKKSIRIVALAAAATLVLSACGGDGDNPGADGTTPETAYKACMVTDIGGIDDKSFNAAAYEGLQLAEEEFGAEIKYAQSSSDADYIPNINQLITDGCETIFLVGFLMNDAAIAAARANPDINFAIIDQDGQDHGPNGDVYPGEVIDNLKGLQFNTAESAFLAGYLAAGMSKTGKVATYGGIPIPPVTIFMDGFWEGVQYYNEVKGANVRVLGWDQKNPASGSFAGSFQDVAKGQQLSKNFEQQGADIIFPVAGGVGEGSGRQALASKKSTVIWVDSDGYFAAPQFQSVILTSVVKGIANAVRDVVGEAINGNFSPNAYVGTLENGGTLLAPFHDFDGQVSDALKSELEDIAGKISSGEIKITSPSQP